MSPARFAVYREQSIAEYARENVAGGRWVEDGALERARRDHEGLLPQGLDTPDHFLFDIVDDAGAVVGVLWFALMRRHGQCTAYVYSLHVDAAHRRQGHARRALEAFEALARALGAHDLGLNVFAYNHGAQALYASLGYVVTNSNMRKRLAAPGA
jgi:ribosomal protein S18 acetylase RimI-like enzyme